MDKLLHSRSFYIIVSLSIIALMVILAVRFSGQQEEPLVTTQVEFGPVRELVSVSGIAEAQQTAELAFPTTGIVDTVNVSIGDQVTEGDVLISLNSNALLADRQDALAALDKAIATRDELIEGPTVSAREISSENVRLREEALERTKETENQKVANAYRRLLSTDLQADTTDPSEEAVPPTVSGTYSCDNEGTYVLETYSSGSNSGYSFRLSGLEAGTYPAFVDQPGPFGNCGLRVQFDENSQYRATEWTIDIPNLKSPQYVINRNAYSLALTQRDSALSAARQALSVAQAESSNQNAPARSEAVSRANASIAQAESRLARIDSTIADRTLTAPFTGTITEIDILPGETVTTVPVVTLLANNNFEITARIPEIDIGKLVEGQTVEMRFDARDTELVTGEIEFISLQSTEIDGAAYYKAIISLDETPDWMRSGLNADLEIIIIENTGGLRIPKRFVSQTETGYEVLLQQGGLVASSTIDVVLEGNDGYVSITGLQAGDIIVAP